MIDPIRTGADDPTTVELRAAARLQRIDRYRVDKLLGEGGFGQVYLTYDEQLQRFVAVKVPHRILVTRPEDVEAYLDEARTVANLDHPNIVPVYDVGSTADCPFFVVSKFIEGSTLAERLKQGRFAVAEAVQLVAMVAETLHYAHGKGLVHRDIKPGNILLENSGKPYVADFGLALKEENVGQGPRYAGTPAYMSPEQARGEGHRVDGRSDIFSLGIVLYQLLTGRRPFHAESREDLLEQIANMEVRPPRQLEVTLPKELERICLKALSKRASERYPTAQDLGDELRRFLAEVSAEGKATLQWQEQNEAEAATAMPSPVPTSAEAGAIPIVPKGLRSFEATDADFFLALLPGPYDRDGLPESIRFWKNRIEKQADNTFAVGLIYGPSGCGKSSLVKAGLLPRLVKAVKTVCVDATADDTEGQLLKGLRRQVADLPPGLGLVDALTAVRQGQFLKAGHKVLLVLDQFEQWLHAKRREENTVLVQALRQCNGDRVQCLILVRDDFWLAVSRFMQALEVRVLEGENARLVDLFDMLHAHKVLARFGRAYGRLPDKLRDCTKEQQAFLDQAIAGLALDGKVISVRLALFAEMVKGKQWTAATLRDVGGMEGIGVTFLEETFTASTAPPEHRLHRKAVQAVLSALLPRTGVDIKGQVRSRDELLELSGYRQAEETFGALMRILDGETRLLTPMADQADLDDHPPGAASATAGEPCYQLTHDYLVPSIREWLVRKQKETRRGRAELRLAERTALWQARPERRQLPSLIEWLSIRLLTAPRRWTDAQRQMMRAATRKHLSGIARMGVFLLMLACAALVLRSHWEERRAAARADNLVRHLLDADIARTPALIDEIGEHRQWTDPQLQKVLAVPTAPRDHRLHAQLALLPVDSRHADELRETMLEAGPIEFAIIREALRHHQAALVDSLWDTLESSTSTPKRRFRAAAALAAYDPSSQRWSGVEGWVAKQLVAQPSLLLPRWVEDLRPVKGRLIPSLVAILRDRTGDEGQSPVVAEVVGEYASNEPDILAEAIAYAAPDSFLILFSRLEANPNQAVMSLKAMLDRIPANGGAAPNKSASQRANLAIALLRFNVGERLWPLLERSPDPRVRSFLIDRIATLGCDPASLLARLATEPDDTIRAALWLSLGHYTDASLPAARRVDLSPRLLDVYHKDSSAAVHAAAYWVMGRWEVRDNQQLEGSRVDKANKWYVNSLGQTMVQITGPGTYLMGPLPDEKAPRDDGKGHEVKLEYSYDIGMTEVTLGQFRRFLEQKKRRDMKNDPRYAEQADLDPDIAVTNVIWFDAAAFCNWLSDMEGIPENQWCFEPNDKKEFGNGMKIKPNATSLAGYRLPTEVEWEYACRGGARTMRCYGDADELLSKYAWNPWNAGNHAAPVARLLPNAFGLFDMHGNAMEWCLGGQSLNDLEDGKPISSSEFRAARGGNIFTYARAIRTANGLADRPAVNNSGGFRIARSHL